jgi:hypothetical protein
MIKKLEHVKIKKDDKSNIDYIKSESLVQILNMIIDKQNEIIDFVGGDRDSVSDLCVALKISSWDKLTAKERKSLIEKKLDIELGKLRRKIFIENGIEAANGITKTVIDHLVESTISTRNKNGGTQCQKK